MTQEEQSESNVSERRPRRRRRFNEETSTRRDRIPPEVEAEEMNRAPIVPPEEYMQEAQVRTAPIDQSELRAAEPVQTIEPHHVNVESNIANVKREPVTERPRAEEVTVATEQSSVSEPIMETEVADNTVEVIKEESEVVATESMQVVEQTQEETDALKRLTAGLDEALAQKGLTVVHTRAELVHPVDYSPVIYPGRPRKVLPPLDDTPLIQVHTKTL